MVKIHILGAGTPRPTPTRFGSAYVLEVGTEKLLFDCGPATTWKLAKAGMSPAEINDVFFTHHHYDHDVDYPCFILNRWGHHDWGRLETLRAYGPKHTEALTDRILNPEYGAWAPDWIARTKHPASLALYTNHGGVLPRQPPSVAATDIGPGEVVKNANWRVTAAEADHFQPFLDSLAYRVDTDSGSVVFTGDTAPCESVVELARGADLMICMCWDLQSEMDLNGECAGQCGTTGAGRMAQDAGVSRLVLTHLEPQMAEHGRLEKGIAEVSRVYDGEILVSEELMTVAVNEQ